MKLRKYIEICNDIEELRAMALDIHAKMKQYKKLLKEHGIDPKDTRPVFKQGCSDPSRIKES